MAVTLTPLGHMGRDLQRPECVVVAQDGSVVVSDSRGGVSVCAADGAWRHRPCPGGATNGVALDRDGTLYLAGIDSGTVHALAPDGTTRCVIDRFKGQPLGAVNFVHFDPHGRLWVTISTRVEPRSRAIEQPIPDGYVLKVEDGVAHLAAGGLCFANEIRFDPAMRFAYLAESRMGRVLRMAVGPEGTLGTAETFGPERLFDGAIVDGLAFDAQGGLWVSEVTRNGIHRITPDGRAQCLFEDPAGAVVDFPASIAFGGADRRTVFVGSIRADHLVTFRSSVAGAPMWHHL
ncbi:MULTISPECIES: SMP-30/gluconolactonase/LRE family protein [unclassified Novosphingobium]|uniref:SMP-30/gluconolactonase/LRE family protein n=1 Tax=unclassified Novosphingobium TaxID=2644732 RepID=UPI00146E09C6|nr:MULTISPECIES: SMP-30/gluconolactonase/LRE family protein [unclassified Novosphingobium]NMN05943.1 sugar lactone lactonase YvrE [Novosphingobium sp. SG919]NMN88239.1 sugar lactone lactonase YvrE [Novosphingobium sp. SG916]